MSSGGKRRIMCTLSSLDKFELKSFYFVNENFNTYITNNLKYMGNNIGSLWRTDSAGNFTFSISL